MRKPRLGLALLALAVVLPLAAHAAEPKVVVAYQTGAFPYFVGIANGDLARSDRSGDRIPPLQFRRRHLRGHCLRRRADRRRRIEPVRGARSAAGIDVKAFYIASGSGDGEASWSATARHQLAWPTSRARSSPPRPSRPTTTSLLAVLKQEGIGESDAQVIAIPQPEIVAGLEARRHRRRLRLGSGARAN